MKKIIARFLCIAMSSQIFVISVFASAKDNLFQTNEKLTKEIHGVKYICTEDTVCISGIPQKSSFLVTIQHPGRML